eukprot:1742036-Rhodomonas_salina.2
MQTSPRTHKVNRSVSETTSNRALHSAAPEAQLQPKPSDAAMLPQVLFLLAGQSNIAGRGSLLEAPQVTPHLTQPAPIHATDFSAALLLQVAEDDVQVLQLVGRGERARWEEASEPLFRDVDSEQLRALAGSPSKRPTGPSLHTLDPRPWAQALDPRPSTLGPDPKP